MATAEERINDLKDALIVKLNELYFAEEDFILQEEFVWQSGAQIFNLKHDFKQILDVFVNMKKLSPRQFAYSYNRVEILDELEAGDVVFIKYSHRCNFDKVYGIRRDKTILSPDWERIGKDMSLHASLPIQTKMKRCLLKDDGTVNYYLHDTDSTKKADGTDAVLDGTDGQLMVEIPEHFQRFNTYGNVQHAWFSIAPFPGSFRVPRMYVSFAEANIHRPTNTLASVISNSPDYRGGDNQSSWDNEPRTQLADPQRQYQELISEPTQKIGAKAGI